MARNLALIFLLAAIWTGLASSQVTWAQRPAQGEPIHEALQAELAPLQKRLDEITIILEGETVSEDDLTALRAELDRLNDAVLQSVIRFQPKISEMNSRLDGLPPPPAEGEQAETGELANERRRLTELKDKATLTVRDAELLTVRANTLVSILLEKRREQFLNKLLLRRTLDTSNFTTVFTSFGSETRAVVRTLSDWVTKTLRPNPGRLIALLVIMLFVFGLLHIMFRPLRRWLARLDEAADITYLQRVTMAFFTIILPASAFAALAFTLDQSLHQLGLYRLRVDEIVEAALTVLTGVAFVWLLLRAILSPTRPAYRLLSMTSSAAWRLLILGIAMALVYGLDYFASRIITLFSMPVAFTVVKSLLATLLLALILILAVTTRLEDADPDTAPTGYRGWNLFVFWAVWASIFAIVIAEVSGYVALGRFMAGQIIITGSILATMYIGFLAARALAVQGAMASTSLGTRLRESRDWSDMRYDQLGLLTSGIIQFLVLIIGLPVLALQWGFQADEVLGWGRSALLGFNIGTVEISPLRILVALLVFLALIAMTRYVQRWFDDRVLVRTQLDSGVKNSIKAGVGYVGFFIAALIGFSWAGFNLSNIALIAGALSVGIGFGLQNIVNNFVSGIIMLIERPIKVGDIIAVGTTEGFVKKINVRATELETFDRQSIIIPNSEVINTSVGNWMHNDSLRRILINVGVAYGSDVEKVREVLLATLDGDTRIATFPPPFVYFADFGSSSLDFQLRFFVRDIMETPIVETDIRFAIEKAFRESDIKIPFPQRDVHVLSSSAPLDPGE